MCIAVVLNIGEVMRAAQCLIAEHGLNVLYACNGKLFQKDEILIAAVTWVSLESKLRE